MRKNCVTVSNTFLYTPKISYSLFLESSFSTNQCLKIFKSNIRITTRSNCLICIMGFMLVIIFVRTVHNESCGISFHVMHKRCCTPDILDTYLYIMTERLDIYSYFCMGRLILTKVTFIGYYITI